MGFLQGTTGTVASGSTVSFNSNTAANSLLIVVMSDTAAPNSTFAVTDSTDQNNTWTVLTSTGQYPTLSIAYALNTKGGSTDTIKITRSSGGTVNYSIGEYSGVNTFRAATPFAQNGGSGLSPLTTTSLSTTTGDLLLLVGGFLTSNASGPLTPAVTVREGSFTTGCTPTAYGDAISSGGSVAGSVATTYYYAGIILLDFYQMSTAYSVPDCRVSPYGPNTGVTVQGTVQYTGQTSSNSAVPGVDSRAAGAPVDSRVSPNIPQNSRTPGTFGPGE